ncbi:RecE family exodeoxyribonuclease [Klebsiella sp. BIGb0407]|uniref:RecE family exodeoxyribonuclease n=1 Tax=Klebsiella sp. BIGb0407 TaxID=2940603 RepID=UPI002168969D|nr:RecE family exodeoxyribonuclease [Klebsiella sp. BIGb0407]MCS3430066.1 exodeoxyribonuclease VIII [Klebsiella sp. BIGb0407]
MEFSNLIKASQKSGKPSGFFWFSEKTEARAKLRVQIILEDNGIEVGRGHDYQLPALTNFPVVDDLPEEGVIDFTWCDRYALSDDNRTWLPIVKTVEVKPDETGNAGVVTQSDAEAKAAAQVEEFRTRDMPVMTSVCTLPFRQRVVAQFLADKEYAYHIDNEQKKAMLAAEMDTDNAYVQNLILASENESSLKTMKDYALWLMTSAVKNVFPIDAKTPELSLLCRFINIWIDTPHVDRGLLVKEWQSGKRVSSIQRTDKGTNAGGGNKTDRNPDCAHTLDSLDVEIAAATMAPDFDIYSIPGSVHRRAKEIIEKKENPFKEWSAALRSCAGILDYSRAAIFALIRGADEGVHLSPASLQTYITTSLTEYQHDKPSTEMVAAAQVTRESVDEMLAAARGEIVPKRGEGIEGASDPAAQKLDKNPRKTFCTHEENLQRVREEGARRRAEEAALQPKIENLGTGVFSIEGLVSSPSNEVVKQEAENANNVPMEETVQIEDKTDTALSAGESVDAAGSQTDPVNNVVCMSCGAIGGGHCSDCGSSSSNPTDAEVEPSLGVEPITTSDTVTKKEIQTESAPEPAWPEYFEPGRYEGLPNEVYHAANGVSSTMVKDVRVSPMYFNARHVEKTIQKERSKVLDMGNLVHALALQPESLYQEFSVEPEIPEGAFTTTATIRAAIDEYNAGLPSLLSADDIKALIEEHNATLPPQVALGSSLEETGQSYMALLAEFQRIEEGQKQTAAAMKACIKEYNATLPPQVKASGSRDTLLEQLAIINPDLVAQEAQKEQPLKVSGTKTDLILSLKAVKPDSVFADELLDAWRENPEGKILVTRQQLSTAHAIQKALLNHPTAGKLLTHPSRAVEVSYFGIDEETGLDIRVRPDLEIDMGARIGADLKTISMWNIKQEGLRAKLHREIIERDYHLSAAMYCETAALDQFFWIFVNKDENYHWIAIIEASAELLELGMLEYRKSMRAIANGFDTGEWPAPITEDYSEELNDFDVRRLEALRGQA